MSYDYESAFRQQGADRERRRIRRAQAKALAHILRTHGDVDHLANAVKQLDAATLAQRKKKGSAK